MPALAFCLAISAMVRPLLVGVVVFLVAPPRRAAKASPPAAGFGALVPPSGDLTPGTAAADADFWPVGCASTGVK